MTPIMAIMTDIWLQEGYPISVSILVLTLLWSGCGPGNVRDWILNSAIMDQGMALVLVVVLVLVLVLVLALF